ncbi:MAG: molybdopterin converting factor subunit 1 [Moraxellaceae bacterium]|jgi:molybdopterin synthase sulfur carrier subunit|nr:molybdopterin converting factor subunit 1 [Moraxellaceae bacterium]MCC6373881.1 molybdopterin converting factor subunit 1 [Moraxellaceae bacterium]
MNISLCFFARFREQLGIQQELYTLPIECNGHELLAQLAQRGEKWQDLFANPQGVLVAINQEMATLDSRIKQGDEVAFFPPVTGG